MEDVGQFDARYLAFLETIAQLRPRLHAYCSRMTGSVLDGEDVVQEALFHAYRRLDSFDDARPLAPWLFRIAHNRCIDFLRRRGVREEAEMAVAQPETIQPGRSDSPGCWAGHSASCSDSSTQRTRLRFAQGRVRLLTGRNSGAGRLYRGRREGCPQPRPVKAEFCTR